MVDEKPDWEAVGSGSPERSVVTLRRSVAGLQMQAALGTLQEVLSATIVPAIEAELGPGWVDIAHDKLRLPSTYDPTDLYFLLRVAQRWWFQLADHLEDRLGLVQRPNFELLLDARNRWAHFADVSHDAADEVDRLVTSLAPQRARGSWMETPPPSVSEAGLVATSLHEVPLELGERDGVDLLNQWGGPWPVTVTAPHLVAWGPAGMDVFAVVTSLVEATMWAPRPFPDAEVRKALTGPLDDILHRLRITVTEERASVLEHLPGPAVMIDVDELDRALQNASARFDAEVAIEYYRWSHPALRPHPNAGFAHVAGAPRPDGRRLWYLVAPAVGPSGVSCDVTAVLCDSDPVASLVEDFVLASSTRPRLLRAAKQTASVRHDAAEWGLEYWERGVPMDSVDVTLADLVYLSRTDAPQYARGARIVDVEDGWPSEWGELLRGNRRLGDLLIADEETTATIDRMRRSPEPF